MRSTPQSSSIKNMALSRWQTIRSICSCRFNSAPAQFSSTAGGFLRLNSAHDWHPEHLRPQ
jgi:hypothetical protein